MKIAGGLDVGTTGCKISLYNENAEHIHTYYMEYDIVRQSGRQEIDFDTIKNGVMKLLKNAASEYKITALGVTSFGETFAMLDEEDNIIAPSILYTDPRGREECEQLKQILGEENITLQTGVKPHSMYSISKIIWHKNNTPDLYKKCKRILLGEDFIVYSLTGNAQMSYSLAARTGAFDIEKKCWAKEIFDAAGVDSKLMSKPVGVGEIAGKLTDKLKKELGIDYDITVVTACHDQVANMVGSGIFDKTQVMDGAGTVECTPVILKQRPTDIEFYKGGYSVVPFLGDEYACYAFSFTGGATLKWFRDNFAELEHKESQESGKNVYAELDARIKGEPSEILVLPHFSGAATPYMDSDSKAAFVGITLETDKIDLYKALMEGVSYEMLLNLNFLKDYMGEIKEIRATGGGATSDPWLQIKADILDNNITALSCKEVGAAGVAAIAGKAVGIYDELEKTVAKMAPVRKVFMPDKSKTQKYREIYNKYKNLYKAVKSL